MPSPSEVELLICCAHLELDAATSQRIHTRARGPIDWDRLLRLATVQGTLSLLHRNLRRCCPSGVPDAVLSHLEEQYYATAGCNSFLASALVKVLKALESRGVQAVPFKGSVLAVSAFGNLALRHPGDLDILVRPEHVEQARAMLLSLGYSCSYRAESEMHLVSGDRRTSVDLHWRVDKSRFRALLPPAPWWQRLRPVALVGTTVLQFAPEETLLMLALNATKSIVGSRLSHVCDLDAQVRAHPMLDWAHLLKEARYLGCCRMLHAGLLLAHKVLHTPLPEMVRRRASRDVRARGLTELLHRHLLQGDVGLPFQWALHTLLLAEGIREPLACLKVLLTPTEKDRRFLPLPRPLSALHVLVRPIRLLRDFLRGGRERSP